MSHMNSGNSKTVPAHDGSGMEVRLFHGETSGSLSAGGAVGAQTDSPLADAEVCEFISRTLLLPRGLCALLLHDTSAVVAVRRR